MVVNLSHPCSRPCCLRAALVPLLATAPRLIGFPIPVLCYGNQKVLSKAGLCINCAITGCRPCPKPFRTTHSRPSSCSMVLTCSLLSMCLQTIVQVYFHRACCLLSAPLQLVVFSLTDDRLRSAEKMGLLYSAFRRSVGPAAGSSFWVSQHCVRDTAQGPIVCTTLGMADYSHCCSGPARGWYVLLQIQVLTGVLSCEAGQSPPAGTFDIHMGMPPPQSARAGHRTHDQPDRQY